MGDESSSAERDETEWMTEIAQPTRKLLTLLDSMELPADLRPIAFGQMFKVVLSEARGRTLPLRAASEPGPALLPPTARSGAKFARFLADYNLTLESLGNIVDFESAHVLARNLGSTKAESQRRLAAVLALVNAHNTGEFTVSREQLVGACKDHGVLDPTNFASNMSGVEFNGFGVFTRDPNGGYKVSRPGEAYVAEVVKNLLPQG